MIVGERLRELREERNLTQGHIEDRTGLLCCYTSRVENGHTVPSLGTLEKYARALGVPTYLLFYESEEPPKLPKLKAKKEANGLSRKDRQYLEQFQVLLSKMSDGDRKLLLHMLVKMAARAGRPGLVGAPNSAL